MFPLTTAIQHQGVLVNAIKQENEIKNIQIGKEGIKLSLFIDDIKGYVENPRESTKELLELISDYSKVAGHKVNIQKSVAFLYNSSEPTVFEIKKKTLFIWKLKMQH